MKFRSAGLYVFFIVVSFCVNASAEYVFKKDGAIIKGSILRDDPSYLLVKSDKGGTERISRSDIMRILYTDLYMGKVYVRMTSGEVVEGYQVDEDRDNYVFRKVITSPEEFTLSRKKVMFIARTNPTDLVSETSIEKIVIRWSPPFKPAKLYRVYMRENRKGETFKVIGETDDTEYTLKKLGKSASFEVYVTGIGDTGEESLPSEKIITNTRPVSPEDLVMTEKKSGDGKSVTLTMNWKPVKDAASRVKSYAIYRLDDKERKKLGTVTGNEYIIKDFPADGKNWFAVVSVNDMGTESADVKAVYDAGYRIYARASGAYLVPNGDLGVIADSGYGGLVDLSMGGKFFSAGIETGYLKFSGADDEIESMALVPILALADYRMPLIFTLAVRPLIKAGTAYVMTEYIKHDADDPSQTDVMKKNGFDPMASAGLYLDFGLLYGISICGGAEYSVIFQESGRMSFLSYTMGVSAVF